MSWRIVYVTEVNHLSLNLNSLKVTKGDQEVKIPLGDIFALVIEDLTVTLSTRLLVDLYLLKNPPEEFMTREYRLNLINLMHARVEIDGKMQTVIRAIEVMIQSIIDYFRTSDEKVLKFPSLNRYEFYEL